MPNIKSAKKRVEVNERNKEINKSYKSELATALKKYNSAVNEGNKELVKKLYPVTVSLLDESVTRGVIHKNKADRKKAEISSKLIAVSKAHKAKKVEEKPAEVKKEEIAEVKEEKPAKTKATAKTKKAEAKEKPVKEEKKAAKEPAKKRTTKKETK